MKTKIVSTLTAATICACACIGASYAPARIVQEDNDTVTIGVAKSFEDMNILTDTEASYEYGWIYNMVYDRLFTVGDDGRLIPGLAVECELYSDYEPMSIFTSKSFLSNTAAYNSQLKQARSELPYPEWIYSPDFMMYSNPENFLFFGDGDSAVYLRVVLREDVMFTDGQPVTSEAIRDYIAECYSQENNTVVNKIWSSVFGIMIESETVFDLCFNIPNDHGFIDFLYEIASPYGGIVNPYHEDQNIGSGAYLIEECGDDVTLSQNEDWWGEPVNTQTVRFICAPIKDVFESGEADIWQMPSLQDREYFEIFYPNVTVTQVATNPLVCLYNADNEILSDERMRKALSLAVGYNEPFDIFLDFLLPVSNGYWALTPIEKSTEMAQYYVDECGWNGCELEFNLILSAKDGSEVLDLAYYIQESLRIIGIKVNISPMNESDYKNAVQSGNYDIALSYIDLNDPDSAYKAFYPTYDDMLDEMLDKTILSATTKTFLSMQYYNQMVAYENALFMNFGWNSQAFAQQDYISGVNYFDYKGYINYDPVYGLSDANLVDFRWVEKQA